MDIAKFERMPRTPAQGGGLTAASAKSGNVNTTAERASTASATGDYWKHCNRPSQHVYIEKLEMEASGGKAKKEF